MKATRYFEDIPKDVEIELLRSTAEVVGKGYTPEYYASIAGDFVWLFQSGYRRALYDQRARKRRAMRKAK